MCPDSGALDVNDTFCWKGDTVGAGGILSSGLEGSKTASNSLKVFFDGSLKNTSASNTGLMPDCPVALGARQTTAGTADNFSTGQMQVAWCGSDMTDTDMSNIAAASAALCSALGRTS